MTATPTKARPDKPPKAGAMPQNLRGRLDQQVMRALFLFLSRLLFRFYGRWTVIGLENVPTTGGVLVTPNHTSYLDPLLVWAAIAPRRRLWGVAKVELWNWPLLGYAIDCIGSLPAHRGAADRTLFRQVQELLARGEAVGIFPEGTRSADGTLLPGLPGVAIMVQKGGVPVVPCALIGAYEMLPTGAGKLRRVPLKVVFGTPLTFGPDIAREAVVAQIMEAIAALQREHGLERSA